MGILQGAVDTGHGAQDAASRMTREPEPARTSYRPAVRGLWFGIAALALHVAATAIVWVHTGPIGLEVTPATRSVPFLALACHLTALVSVGYAAIATHRREWGRALVATWSIVAAIELLPFLLALR
jgi:hypothetical protein